MSELRIVIDTSAIISAMLLADSIPRRAFDLALKKGKVLISEATVAELDEVLRRPKFNKYLTEELRLEFLAALILTAGEIRIVESISVCRDPKDDKFLELAVNGSATHLISGDKDLLALNPFRGTLIVAPQAFIESIEAKS